MASYEIFLESIAEEVALFRDNQAKGMAREELRYLWLSCALILILMALITHREKIYLQEWEAEKVASIGALQVEDLEGRCIFLTHNRFLSSTNSRITR